MRVPAASCDCKLATSSVVSDRNCSISESRLPFPDFFAFCFRSVDAPSPRGEAAAPRALGSEGELPLRELGRDGSLVPPLGVEVDRQFFRADCGPPPLRADTGAMSKPVSTPFTPLESDPSPPSGDALSGDARGAAACIAPKIMIRFTSGVQ